MIARGWTLPGGVAAVLLIALPAEAPAQDAESLRFCVGRDNLPLADADPPSGIEVDFARALGSNLEREVRFEWLGMEEPRPDEALLAGRCHAALGAVLDAGTLAQTPTVTPGLAFTLPYYAAGYVVVRRAGASPVPRLTVLGKSRIGVEMESVAIYTLKQRGINVHALDDYHAVIRALADGRLEHGYLWGPLAAWQLKDRTDVVVDRTFDPVERWNFAIALRAEERTLREQLNAVIHEMVRDGQVARIFAVHGVPYLTPNP